MKEQITIAKSELARLRRIEKMHTRLRLNISKHITELECARRKTIDFLIPNVTLNLQVNILRGLLE